MRAFGCHVVICMSIVPSYLYLVHEHAKNGQFPRGEVSDALVPHIQCHCMSGAPFSFLFFSFLFFSSLLFSSLLFSSLLFSSLLFSSLLFSSLLFSSLFFSFLFFSFISTLLLACEVQWLIRLCACSGFGSASLQQIFKMEV